MLPQAEKALVGWLISCGCAQTGIEARHAAHRYLCWTRLTRLFLKALTEAAPQRTEPRQGMSGEESGAAGQG
jgi:hypothetical protein